MAVTGILAHATVRDISVAERWYARLFDRDPDARPMAGLLEWHFGDRIGVQVWRDPDRAGHSTVVVQVDDLDAFASRVNEAGLTSGVPQPATASRILVLDDPDGNRIVVVGP